MENDTDISLEEMIENENLTGVLDLDYNYTYCSAEFAIFWQKTDIYILNLNVLLCIFGVFANILNLLVYSRKHMLNPTNLILASISFSDLLVMIFYIPQYFAKLEYTKQNSPYSAAVIWIVHEYFLSVFHPVAIWLNITLAIFRYIAVIHVMRSRFLCTMKRAKIAIISIVIFNILICIPGYLAVSIVEADETKSWRNGGCESLYCAKWTSFNFLRKIEFLYQGFFSKVFPSIILTYVSISLILALLKAHKERKRLTNPDNVAVSSDGDKNQKKDTAAVESKKDFDRTTRMLLVILLVFLITELPPGAVHIMEVIGGPNYYFECRRPVHYLILTMYFLSGVLNFPVYLFMSKNYRQTLAKILRIKTFTKVNRLASKESAQSASSDLSAKTQDSTV